MNNKIVFIRHGKVKLPYASHDEMPLHVLQDLATQKLDPESDEVFIREHTTFFKKLFCTYEFEALYISPSRRCISLASQLQEIFPRRLPQSTHAELQEVMFDIHALLPNADDFSLSDISEQLYRNLINEHEGVENIHHVDERLKSFLNKAGNRGNVLALSHGYAMKIFATLIHSGPDSHIQIRQDNLDQIPKFGYFDGFSVDESSSLSFFKSE